MAEKTPKKKSAAKGRAPRAKGGGKKSCTVAGCKRAYRAKGYCFFHYKKWRRKEGGLPHSRYRTCNNAECRKPAAQHGLCEAHWAAASGKGAEAAKPAEAPAAPAA